MMTDKKLLGVVFITTFLISPAITNFAVANPTYNLPYITIKSDGTIDPQTDLVKREGNIYYLTANLTQNAVKIQCSNIVFDGGGYYIIGGDESTYYISGNSGLCLESVANVTAKNVQLIAFSEGFALNNCVNCSVLRVKVDPIQLQNSNFNTITECDIGYRNHLFFLFRNSSSNIIYNNNITIWYSNSVDVVDANFWDNGSVGNYWTLYSGVDSNGDGIGDTVYTIDAPYNIDHYPLMKPYVQKESPPSPTPTQEPQPEPTREPPFSYTLIAGIAIALVVIAVCVVVCVFHYRNKRLK